MDQFSQTERRLQVKMDERVVLQGKHDELLRSLDGASPSEAQAKQMKDYRSDMADVDTEIEDLSIQAERDREAAKKSEMIRKAANPNRHAQAHIGSQGVAPEDIQRAADRLKTLDRTPATTLSSDIAGLTPPQHVADIFQIINADRPLVDAARKVNLTNLVWTYPQLDASPVVAVQGTQKTEAGNTGMDVSMVTKTASTYLGGGNLSWQAITFSSPDAYDLWFQLIAADYALKTETDAATVVSASAFLNNIASTIATTATFAEFMTAVGAGYAEVYANSGRVANALIMAPDRFGYLLGLTSAAITQFVSVGQAGVGPLRVIVSRGLNAGEIIVGDMNGLLVAENAGAPVRMFVSEPAIAGVEVGLVGAFDAAVADDGAFALISTAS
jgi:HK97 family phage major capsid protein